AASIALEVAGKRRLGQVVAHWASILLIMGVYNKLVKTFGARWPAPRSPPDRPERPTPITPVGGRSAAGARPDTASSRPGLPTGTNEPPKAPRSADGLALRAGHAPRGPSEHRMAPSPAYAPAAATDASPRRRTRPGRAIVMFPPSTTTTPCTSTYGIPTGYWCGSSNVARSATVSGSKTTTS